MGKDVEFPKPPDPAATAQAQAQYNKETAMLQQKLNMVDQVTPTGSLTYTQNANDPERWTSTATLTPEAQAAWDKQQAVQNALSGTALDMTNQISSTLGTPVDFKSAPKMPTTLNLKSYDPNSLPNGPQTLDLASLGEMPQGLDYSTLGVLPNAPTNAGGDTPVFNEQARQRAEDALYGLNTARLDPQYALERKDLENRLINSGAAMGTPLYEAQMAEFDRKKASAYQEARNNSIAGAVDYGSKMFGNELEGYKTALASALGIRQVGSSEMEKALASEMGIRGQGLSEMLAKAGIESDYAKQALAKALSGAQMNLAQEQAKAAQANAAHQQYISEEAYKRNLPLNEIGALLGTGQVSMPSFAPPPATSVANTDFMGATYNSANLAMDAYKQQQQANSSALGGLLSMGGMILGGPLGGALGGMLGGAASK